MAQCCIHTQTHTCSFWPNHQAFRPRFKFQGREPQNKARDFLYVWMWGKRVQVQLRCHKMSFKSERVVPWLFLHACHSVSSPKVLVTMQPMSDLMRYNGPRCTLPQPAATAQSSWGTSLNVEICGGVSSFASKWILVHSVCSDDSSQCWWHSEDISTSDFGQVSSDCALLTVILFDWYGVVMVMKMMTS